MAPIRLMHIIGQLTVGGCETQLLGLCRRMDRTRFDITVCWYSPGDGELADAFAAAGVRLIRFDKFAMPLWRFFLRLRREIRAVRPDIVHTWLSSANFWGRWAALSCGAPGLVASYRNELKGLRRIETVYERVLGRRSLRLANSEVIARTARQAFKLGEADVQVIRNGVAEPGLDEAVARSAVRAELGLPADCPLVLMVGRLTRAKNYPMYVRVAGRVGAARPDVVFLVAGDGPDRATLERLSREEGLGERLRWLGQRGDVDRLLAAVDLFCFTSDSEGFPNAVLEAMMAGRAVVCTDFAAIAEILDTPDLGVVVPRGDDQAMAAAVLDLMGDGDRRRRLGAAARQIARERYGWDRLVDRMQQLYVNLAKGTR